ncbi:hypothetical protein MUK42_14841, partial [Musa troglodytarum]
MASLHAMRKAQRARGPATIMAIGTANPPNLYEQSTYPDYYFRVTNSEHMQELKHKFQRICEKTMVKRRYLYLTEEILKERPKLCSYMEPSFDDRQDIVVEEVPKLAKEAATKAIKEWGRSMSDITHLVFCSISGIDMPGADYRLAKLLGLPLSVNRIMLYSQACHMGAAMLRIAKDLAENNKGARVLVVSCEITVLSFRGPDEHDFQALAGQAGKCLLDQQTLASLYCDGTRDYYNTDTRNSLYKAYEEGETPRSSSRGFLPHHSSYVYAATMAGIHAFRKAQRPQRPATIMAIGTANPPNLYEQSTFPDFYFRVTNSDHMPELKDKFRRICGKTMIKKRYMHLTEEVLKQKPGMCSYMDPSFDERQEIVVEEVPRLAKEAAAKAIKEWGRDKSGITHLVFCSTSGIDMPGADYRLVKLLDLPLSVNRIMLYNQACHIGAQMLRIAKDIAENNKDARVLVVACELNTLIFRGPDERDFLSLAGQAAFADGAAAVIVGADPIQGVEKPIFEMMSASQVTVPDCEKAVGGHLKEIAVIVGADPIQGVENPIFEMMSAAQVTVPDCEKAVGGHLKEIGLTFHFMNQLPMLISNNLENCLLEAFKPLGITDWNEVFWVSHPGNWGIMDAIEKKVGLKQEKLRSSRHVFGEYGNMMSATVLFVMDDVRKRSAAEGRATTGDGLEWGVLFGFGPGLTIETVVLR